MTPEQVEQRFERMEALLIQTIESQAKTEAIVKSNARAIEATANEGSENRRIARETQRQLGELAQIVGQFVEATNTRLGVLED